MNRFVNLALHNPIAEYLRYLADCALLPAKYEKIQLGYMSKVRNCVLGAHVRLGPHASLSRSKVGSYSYIGTDSIVARAEIGRFCSIASGCRIGLGAHPSRGFVSTHPAFYDVGQLPYSFVDERIFDVYGKVKIGNDVFIGTNVLIADGVTIGNGAIVGAGAVVVRSIPDYAVFGGVPARFIRYRFSASEIAWLNELGWWDKDETWIRAHARAFGDIQTLMRATGYRSEVDAETSANA